MLRYAHHTLSHCYPIHFGMKSFMELRLHRRAPAGAYRVSARARLEVGAGAVAGSCNRLRVAFAEVGCERWCGHKLPRTAELPAMASPPREHFATCKQRDGVVVTSRKVDDVLAIEKGQASGLPLRCRPSFPRIPCGTSGLAKAKLLPPVATTTEHTSARREEGMAR